MEPADKPCVLFVYYTYTKQTLKVVETMADVLRDRGCGVELAGIEFVDPRYADRFKHFPMPHPFREVVGMIPAELRRRPGEIRIPDVVTERAYGRRATAPRAGRTPDLKPHAPRGCRRPRAGRCPA